jgi:hypothetical protein
MHRVVLLLILASHASLIIVEAWQCSPTRIEAAHLAAGISHWRFSNFGLYRVNPPLTRMVAAVPVIVAGATEDWSAFNDWPRDRAEFAVGRDFVAANGPRTMRLMFLARLVCLPFSILGACVCYRWASDLYGTASGVCAMALWCFCPIVLGHAAVVTPDVGATSLGTVACYAFWRWLRNPTWAWTVAAALALGLAELAKFTWVVLFLVWPLTALTWFLRRGTPRVSRVGPLASVSRRSPIVQLAAICAVAVYVINVGYGFGGSGQRLGDYHFNSRLLKDNLAVARPELDGRHNRFAGTWLQRIPIPLPRDYVLGMDVQRGDFERALPTFYRGAWCDSAPWYAYLYGLAVKLPLATICIVVLGIVTSFRRDSVVPVNADELVLLAPAATVLVAACFHSGLNSQVRYVMPALPFVFIWSAKSLHGMASASCRRRWLAGALLLWSIGTSLWNHPHQLAYFNELTRGSRAAPPMLLDSNLDWGQDLLHLKDWMRDHPEARPVRLGYFGSFEPTDIGIDALPAEDDCEGRSQSAPPPPGFYAISVGALWDRVSRFAYFRGCEPTCVVGRTIYIYEVRETEE